MKENPTLEIEKTNDEEDNNTKIEENEPLLKNKDLNKKELLINKIIEKSLFTKYFNYALLCLISVFITYGIAINYFTTIIIPIQQYFKIDHFILEFISSIIFIGIAIGSGSVGYLTKKLGRIMIINSSLILLSIITIIMSIFLNLSAFIICRILMGLCLGLILPISLNIASEYISQKYRCLFLGILWSFTGLGNLILNLIAFMIIPQLKYEKLRLFNFILCIFPLFTCVICFFYFNDSPRNMIIHSQNKNLVNDMLSSMNKKTLTVQQIEQIYNEMKEIEINNKIEGKISNLFSPIYFRTTILLIFLFFIYSCNSFGLGTINPLTMEKLIKQSNNININTKIDNNDDIINLILISSTSIITAILGGFLGEIKKLGRKGTMNLSSGIIAIILIFAPMKLNLFQFLSPILIGCVALYGNILFDYLAEVYHTSLRDISTGILLMIFRISIFITQYFYFESFKYDYKIPYYVSCFLSIVNIGLVYCLPYEVVGKPLDTNYE